jgi:ubiquinone/menaquinone biosynthesis C-methylase UbiE
MAPRNVPVTQSSKPSGWLGRLELLRMNRTHSAVTDWGLQHVSIRPHDTILDIGCGGGRTIAKLANKCTAGKVYGVDYSETSVTASRKTNSAAIARGSVDVGLGSVSHLPFPEGTFDLVTAVETHFWWPDLPGDVREILRVSKPGGTLILVAEVYRGANTAASRVLERRVDRTGLLMLSVDDHRRLLADAGFCEVHVDTRPGRGWICATGRKPFAAASANAAP